MPPGASVKPSSADSVSPDLIIADKATGKVKQYEVAEKTVITVLTEKGTKGESAQ